VIAWLNPWAFAGLAVLASPILIHLLRRHRAPRVVFPSLRFVHPARTAAARMRALSDPWLLLLRMAVLAAAVCALAQPVFLTSSRVSAWNARVARAVVVDTSDSLRLLDAEGAAREAAQSETDTAFVARRIESAALQEAAAWLATAPPARRELVIVSDFQNGVLDRVSAADVPATIGRRAVPVGVAATERRLTGTPRLAGRSEIAIDPTTTRVTVTAGPAGTTGVRVLTAPGESAAALMRLVAAAGTPAPSPEQPMAIAFAGAEVPVPGGAIQADWMLHTVIRMMADPDLQAAAASAASPAKTKTADPWTDVIVDAQQRPLVRAAAAGPELVLEVMGAPESYLAAAAVRGALSARLHPSVYDEQEIARATAAQLSDWSRDAPPVGKEVAVHADRTDARWFWALALVMLAVEALVRRSGAALVPEAQADAA
jgi:hypothetical protein